MTAVMSQNQTSTPDFNVYLHLSGKQIAAEVDKVTRNNGKQIFGGGVVNGY